MTTVSSYVAAVLFRPPKDRRAKAAQPSSSLHKSVHHATGVRPRSERMRAAFCKAGHLSE